MARNKSSFRRGVEMIENIMAGIAGVLLAILTLSICVSVVMRYILSMSVGWTTQLQEYILYISVLLGAPWVLRGDGHVSIDVMHNLVSKKNRQRLEVLVNFLGAVISAGLFYYGAYATHKNFVENTVIVNVLPVQKWIPLIFIPIMSAVLFLEFIYKSWGKIQILRGALEQTDTAEDDISI